MNTLEQTDIHLEAQEAFDFVHPARRSSTSLPSTIMTTTLLFVIPRKTITEICEIPMPAWRPVQRIVRDSFHGDMSLHEHAAAGQFHDFAYISVPHYAVEITVDEDQTKDLLSTVKPLINEIAARYTRKVADPAGS